MKQIKELLDSEYNMVDSLLQMENEEARRRFENLMRSRRNAARRRAKKKLSNKIKRILNESN